MNKNKALQAISGLIKEQGITKAELMALYDGENPTAAEISTSPQASEKTKFRFSEVMYYIGAGIIILSVFILMSLSWGTLTHPLRILFTLGLGIISFAAGFSFSKNPGTTKVALAFYFISSAVLPLGIVALLESVNIDPNTVESQSLISAIAATSMLCLAYGMKRVVFLVFGIVYATWLYFSLVNLLFANSVSAGQIYQYAILLLGVSYLALAYNFSHFKTGLQKLSGALYSFGSIFLLGAALWLGGWSPNSNLLWEAITPLLVFLIIYLSVLLSRTSLLVWGSIFLVVYIAKLNAEYFADSVGWPLILMLIGLIIIAVSFGATKLKKLVSSK